MRPAGAADGEGHRGGEGEQEAQTNASGGGGVVSVVGQGLAGLGAGGEAFSFLLYRGFSFGARGAGESNPPLSRAAAGCAARLSVPL